ncbi:uncharacterized protein LOC110821937 [Carica papaya]|uniref:uncharacterized protein LOC110821937 n=1 Tax=Carica papaya TaxID=3649 RepID=UPI000B8C8F37|nr:uncharacterized protein LOC110821937 [Carica papaya]
MAMCMVAPKLSNLGAIVSFPSSNRGQWQRCSLMPVYCAPLQEVRQEVDVGIMCEPCNGKGWLLCDFCEGQKINVKAANKRIYRRCPSCRAVGYVLCSKCKVFKCVTFPDSSDGDGTSF